MLKNYLKIIYRNILKNKIFSFINIGSLSTGIFLSVLIILYIYDELSYDKFHINKDSIYRIHRVTYNPDGSVQDRDASLPFPLGPSLVRDLPEVETSIRIFNGEESLLKYNNYTKRVDVLFADKEFFDVFSFPLITGRSDRVLEEKSSVVLSEKAAGELFGKDNPIGKTLSFRFEGSFRDYTVTGVAANVPGNSSIVFDYVLPSVNLQNAYEWFNDLDTKWNMSAFSTFIRVRNNADINAIDKKINKLRRKYLPDEYENEDRINNPTTSAYNIETLADIHLNPEVQSGLVPPGSIIYSYILGAIAAGILIIAIINFVLLSVGRSSSRSREISVRKVVGANRIQLVKQFYGETLIITLVSFIVGIVLVELLLPVFNQLANKNLELNVFTSIELGAVILFLLIATALLSGIYPAVILSSLHPIQVLKRKVSVKSTGFFIKILIIAQFVLSTFLIIGMIIMNKQMDYLYGKNLGFNKDQMLIMNLGNAVDGSRAYQLFKERFSNDHTIEGITASMSAFGKGYMRNGFPYKGQLKQIYMYNVYPGFVDLLDISLKEGRDFNTEITSDTINGVLVNDALVKDFGFKEPIGKVIEGLTNSPETDPVIIGVMKNFNFRSLREQVTPVMFQYRPSGSIGVIIVKIKAGSIAEGISRLKKHWENLYPSEPFDFTFLDENLQKFYEAEQKWNSIISYSSFLAVLIACMGLFGLSSLAVERRTKEIGIRKILGSSVTGIFKLLSRELLVLVIIANLITWPAAYYAANTWLQNYAYRIPLNISVFLLSGAILLIIALFTISYKSLKAARLNPVEVLNYE